MGGKGPVRRQIVSSICGNLLTASFGSSLGWASANFLELQKADTTFPSGPLSLKQATTWISLTFIGGIIANLVFPHFVEKYGCKRLMLVIGFPQILNWLLIIYAQNPYYLYVSSIMGGVIGNGQIICLFIFVSEISYDNMRGSLNSFFDPAFNTGMLLSFVLANSFDYVTQAKYLMVLPIAFVILFAKIPDSPQHLVNIQSEKAANKAQKFFKGTEFELVPVNEKKNIDNDSGLHLSDFTNHRARKAMFIGFSLMLLNALQGFNLLVVYVTEIFTNTNPNISPYYASTIITTILILANLVFLKLVDRAGRRTFYIYSSLATALGLALFAIYLYYLSDNRAFDWVPIVCLSYVLFVNCLGMNPVPFLLVIEIFPNNIKQYGYSNCILLIQASAFILTELYPLLKIYIGLFGWIVFFAVMSLCNALFGIIYLPETKGKSHEAIMQLLDQ